MDRCSLVESIGEVRDMSKSTDLPFVRDGDGGFAGCLRSGEVVRCCGRCCCCFCSGLGLLDEELMDACLPGLVGDTDSGGVDFERDAVAAAVVGVLTMEGLLMFGFVITGVANATEVD